MAKARKPARPRPKKVKPPSAVAPQSFFPPSIALTQAHYERQRQKLADESLVYMEMQDRLAELRRYVTGFESSNGYDLRQFRSWTESRKEQIRFSSKRLRGLISQPHVALERNRLSRDPKRRAEQLRSIRYLTGLDVRQFKRFVFPVPRPEQTKIEITRRGKIRIYETHGKQVHDQEFFFYRDYVKYDPVSFEDQKRVLKKHMLPHMPKGYYQLWTHRNGPIGSRQTKEGLARYLQEYHLAYEPPQGPDWQNHIGFASLVVGFIRTGDTREEAMAYQEAFQRMRQQKKKRYGMFYRERYRAVTTGTRRYIETQLAKKLARRKKKAKKKAKKKTARKHK